MSQDCSVTDQGLALGSQDQTGPTKGPQWYPELPGRVTEVALKHPGSFEHQASK